MIRAKSQNHQDVMQHVQSVVATMIGPLYVVASARGLQGVFFKKQAVPLVKSFDKTKPEHRTAHQAVKQLQEYFYGQRQQFDLPYDLVGTEFQKHVWRQLANIPFGQTVSYGQIAQRIKNPRAVRAVGSANGKNPLCIMIPCHRVISSDGTMGGYSGGIKIKKRLLHFEKVPGF